jgi:hypothetical protein
MIVDDLLFEIKSPGSKRKRDEKWRSKYHVLPDTTDKKYAGIVKKIEKYPKIRVISKTGFDRLVEDFLRP